MKLFYAIKRRKVMYSNQTPCVSKLRSGNCSTCRHFKRRILTNRGTALERQEENLQHCSRIIVELKKFSTCSIRICISNPSDIRITDRMLSKCHNHETKSFRETTKTNNDKNKRNMIKFIKKKIIIKMLQTLSKYQSFDTVEEN